LSAPPKKDKGKHGEREVNTVAFLDFQITIINATILKLLLGQIVINEEVRQLLSPTQRRSNSHCMTSYIYKPLVQMQSECTIAIGVGER
jgi:hypothetical protein